MKKLFFTIIISVISPCLAAEDEEKPTNNQQAATIVKNETSPLHQQFFSMEQTYQKGDETTTHIIFGNINRSNGLRCRMRGMTTRTIPGQEPIVTYHIYKTWRIILNTVTVHDADLETKFDRLKQLYFQAPEKNRKRLAGATLMEGMHIYYLLHQREVNPPRSRVDSVAPDVTICCHVEKLAKSLE